MSVLIDWKIIFVRNIQLHSKREAWNCRHSELIEVIFRYFNFKLRDFWSKSCYKSKINWKCYKRGHCGMWNIWFQERFKPFNPDPWSWSLNIPGKVPARAFCGDAWAETGTDRSSRQDLRSLPGKEGKKRKIRWRKMKQAHKPQSNTSSIHSSLNGVDSIY